MAGVKHTFSSPKTDGADATKVRPSDWNAEHTLSDIASQASLDALSNAVSVISQQVSALSQAVSGHSQLFSTLRGGATSTVLMKSAAGDYAWAWKSALAGGVGSVTSAQRDVISNQVSVLSLRVYSSQLTAAVSVSGLVSTDNRLSNAVSIVSQAVSTVSTAASNALSVANAASNAASIVSQAVSVLSQAVSVAQAALSVRVDTQSQSVSVLSQQASVHSQALSVLSQQMSVLSNQVSTLSLRVYSSQLTGAVSVSGLISTDNRLSNAVSVVSTAASNALSVANAASNAASVVSTAASNALSVANAASNAASVVSAAVATLSLAVSVLSQNLSVISQLLSGASVRSVGNISTKGLQSVLNALSNRISAGVGGSATPTSNQFSIVSQQVSAHSQAISVLSQSVSVLSAIRGLLSLRNDDASAVSAGAPVYVGASAANTFLRADADAASAARQAIGLVASPSIAVGATGLVQTSGRLVLTTGEWDSITGQVGGLTVGAKYYLNVTAGLLTTTAPTAGIVRPIGIGLSTTEMQLRIGDADDWTSVINVVSNAVSIVSTAASNALSVANAASNAVSVVSQALSVQAAALSVRIDTQSQSVSVLSQQVSVLSQVLSVHSQQISVLSNQVSVHSVRIYSSQLTGAVSVSGILSTLSTYSTKMSAISAAVTSVDARVNTVSNQASVLSQQVSVLSQNVSALSQAVSVLSQAQSVLSQAVSVLSQAVSVLSQKVSTLQAPTIAVVGGIQTISAATLTNISGLSLSVSAGGTYELYATLLYTLSANAAPIRLGLTFPAMTRIAGVIHGWVSANAQGAGFLSTQSQEVMFTGNSASGSILYSAAGGNSADVMIAGYYALCRASVAGVIQIQAAASTTTGAIHIQASSFLKVFQIA